MSFATHELGSPSPENRRFTRSYGLIDPAHKERYASPALDSFLLEQLDRLSTLSHAGHVAFEEQKTRVDHYLEGRNEVRSIVITVGVTEEGYDDCRVIDVIIDEHGDTYIDKHPSIEDEGAIVQEPEVGDPAVEPCDYLDAVVIARVAYEAIPLST